MAEMLIFGLLLFAGLFSLSQTDRVPVFIWSSAGSVTLPETFSGHTVRRDVFIEEYLIPIVNGRNDQRNEEENEIDVAETDFRNIVIFIQDELSADEVSRNSDVFNPVSDGAVMKHLKDVMSKHDSKYLPSVTSAVEGIQAAIADDVSGIMKLDIVKTIVDAPFELPAMETNENQSTSNLFMIRLPDTESWSNIDKIIGNVTQQLEMIGRPFTAIYTAARASLEPIRESADSPDTEANTDGRKDSAKGRGVGRKLLQYFPSYYTFLNLTNCVYLYSQNITITIDDRTWILPLNPSILDSSYCSNYSALLAFSYYDVDSSLLELTFEMYFGVTTGLNAGYWLMPNFTISYSLYNTSTSKYDNETVQMFSLFITETPYSLSYSCYTPPPIVPLRNQANKQNVNITLVGFQVQAFNISNNEFGYYNDCVGFFTIMTWACLITVFILVGILWFAACMFLGLTTPDRFDDAHGKTITVNAFE